MEVWKIFKDKISGRCKNAFNKLNGKVSLENFGSSEGNDYKT